MDDNDFSNNYNEIWMQDLQHMQPVTRLSKDVTMYSYRKPKTVLSVRLSSLQSILETERNTFWNPENVLRRRHTNLSRGTTIKVAANRDLSSRTVMNLEFIHAQPTCLSFGRSEISTDDEHVNLIQHTPKLILFQA